MSFSSLLHSEKREREYVNWRYYHSENNHGITCPVAHLHLTNNHCSRKAVTSYNRQFISNAKMREHKNQGTADKSNIKGEDNKIMKKN
jgi:hypothetical protein